MPKMKTHSGAKKRFKLTGSGKIKRERAGKRHLRTRRLSGDVGANEATSNTAKRLLGLK